MDPKVIYWTGALVNMGLLTGFAIAGVRQVRRGQVRRHRRSMTIAASLVVLFIASYAVKLALLGREDLGTWSAAARHTLRFHELCVLAMVLSGVTALVLARRLRATRLVSEAPDAPLPDPATHRRHKRAGRVAVIGAVLGFASAMLVLAGMYARL
jgi:putative membrane protein